MNSLDASIENIRQELEALQKKREALRKQRPAEIKELETKYQAAKKELQVQLRSQHQATYMRFLKHDYYEIEATKQKEKKDDAPTAAPSSNYIVQQEAPLLSALHRTFCIFPHQETTTQEYFDKEIIPYFEKKVWAAKMDRDNLDIVPQVTKLAQANTDLYTSYQAKLEAQEEELRALRKQLVATGKYDKEEAMFMAQSNHSHTSMYSDTDMDGGLDKSESSLESPFVHVTKLLMTPTESLSHSIGGGLHNLKLMAGEKFHLPFGQ
ncbi:MAG: hypothetical protein SGILL_004751 [Bacillariaceae sp.]